MNAGHGVSADKNVRSRQGFCDAESFPEAMVRVRIVAPVRPTERPDRVRDAVLQIFPDAIVTEEEGRIVATSADVERFRERIRTQKIRDSARSVLLAGIDGTRTRFRLNKQAAVVGRVNFGSGSPLGDLEVEIEDDDLPGVVDRVAESTREKR